MNIASMVEQNCTALHNPCIKQILLKVIYISDRGILLQDQKRYEEAVESYRNAINFRPKLSSKLLDIVLQLHTVAELHGLNDHYFRLILV